MVKPFLSLPAKRATASRFGMGMLEKIKNNYKSAGKVVFNALRYLKTTSKPVAIKPGVAYAWINLDRKIMNQSGGRFAFLLCRYFEQSGYKVVIKTDLYFYLVLHPHKKALLNKEYFFVRKMHTPLNSIVTRSNGKEQTISVAHGLETIQQKSVDYSLPFPMHPVQVVSFNQSQINRLREEKRTIRVLFSGSWTQPQYKAPLDRYKILTRAEVIGFVVEKFGKANVLRQVSKREELTGLMQSPGVDAQIVVSEVKTRDEDWMELLSVADFFIAPPGFRYPWCHNSIEAMAVGTIPILQYNALFVPGLVHGENCFCFQNTKELEQAINTALAVSEEELHRMRQNVIAYYDRYLSSEAIVQKIKTITNNGKPKLEMAIPYIH